MGVVWLKSQCLDDFEGDVAFVERLVHSVLSYLQETVSKIEQKYQQSDLAEVRKLAHFLKGPSQQLHFQRLFKITQQLERSAQSGQVEQSLILQLKKESEQLAAVLRDFLD